MKKKQDLRRQRLLSIFLGLVRRDKTYNNKNSISQVNRGIRPWHLWRRKKIFAPLPLYRTGEEEQDLQHLIVTLSILDICLDLTHDSLEPHSPRLSPSTQSRSVRWEQEPAIDTNQSQVKKEKDLRYQTLGLLGEARNQSLTPLILRRRKNKTFDLTSNTKDCLSLSLDLFWSLDFGPRRKRNKNYDANLSLFRSKRTLFKQKGP